MSLSVTDAAGRRIRLLRPLGKGGFGSVWLVEASSPDGLTQRLALKLLNEEHAENDQIAARARDEARLMSQLNHEHVVRIHALTQVGRRPAVLMEYVEGVDALALLVDAGRRREGGLPPSIVVGILEQACSALEAAWTTVAPSTGQPLRVVHRDIKPANLLVSSGGLVKVMDFGVARADLEREARTGSVQFGTQRYMAPERWLQGVAGPESDIYSLGVTGWELCLGKRLERLPLAPDAYGAALELAVAELPEPLRPILRAMLAYEPGSRPSAGVLERSLAALDLPGPELRRWCRARVPAMVEERLQKLEKEIPPEAFTASIELGITGPAPARDLPEASPLAAPPTQIQPPVAAPVGGTARGERRPQGSRLARVAVGITGLAALLAGGAGVWFLRPPSAPPAEEGVAPAPVVVSAAAAPSELLPPEAPAADASGPGAPLTAAAPVARKPGRASPDPAPVVAAPEAAPAAEAPSPAPASAPGPSSEVFVKILADPREGSVRVAGKEARASQSIALAPGSYEFVWTWPEGDLRCTQTITPSTVSIKFEQESQRCFLR